MPNQDGPMRRRIKAICESGQLSHDIAMNLAAELDSARAEINRLNGDDRPAVTDFADEVITLQQQLKAAREQLEVKEKEITEWRQAFGTSVIKAAASLNREVQRREEAERGVAALKTVILKDVDREQAKELLASADAYFAQKGLHDDK